MLTLAARQTTKAGPTASSRISGRGSDPQSSTVFDPVMRQRRHVLVSQPSRAIFEDEQPATNFSDSALHFEKNDR
jgi:hypothetical protein